jgi:hypothetical protein
MAESEPQKVQQSWLERAVDLLDEVHDAEWARLRSSQGMLARRLGELDDAEQSYLDSVRFYKTQKEVAIRETMKRLRTGDRAIAEFDYNQRVRSLPDDGKPSLKGMQLALDDIAKDNPKAKNLTVQQLIDVSFLP